MNGQSGAVAGQPLSAPPTYKDERCTFTLPGSGLDRSAASPAHHPPHPGLWRSRSSHEPTQYIAKGVAAMSSASRPVDNWGGDRSLGRVPSMDEMDFVMHGGTEIATPRSQYPLFSPPSALSADSRCPYMMAGRGDQVPLLPNPSNPNPPPAVSYSTPAGHPGPGPGPLSLSLSPLQSQTAHSPPYDPVHAASSHYQPHSSHNFHRRMQPPHQHLHQQQHLPQPLPQPSHWSLHSSPQRSSLPPLQGNPQQQQLPSIAPQMDIYGGGSSGNRNSSGGGSSSTGSMSSNSSSGGGNQPFSIGQAQASGGPHAYNAAGWDSIRRLPLTNSLRPRESTVGHIQFGGLPPTEIHLSSPQVVPNPSSTAVPSTPSPPSVRAPSPAAPAAHGYTSSSASSSPFSSTRASPVVAPVSTAPPAPSQNTISSGSGAQRPSRRSDPNRRSAAPLPVPVPVPGAGSGEDDPAGRRSGRTPRLPGDASDVGYSDDEHDYDSDSDDHMMMEEYIEAGGQVGRNPEEMVRMQQLFRGAMSNKRVASKTALNSLQSVQIDSLPESERTCVICYNEFGVQNPEGTINEAPLRLPHCKHVFGDHCIKKWFEESDSCPYCRDKVASQPMMHANNRTAMRRVMAMSGARVPSSGSQGGLSHEAYLQITNNRSVVPPAAGSRTSRRSPQEDAEARSRRTRLRNGASLRGAPFTGTNAAGNARPAPPMSGMAGVAGIGSAQQLLPSQSSHNRGPPPPHVHYHPPWQTDSQWQGEPRPYYSNSASAFYPQEFQNFHLYRSQQRGPGGPSVPVQSLLTSGTSDIGTAPSGTTGAAYPPNPLSSLPPIETANQHQPFAQQLPAGTFMTPVPPQSAWGAQHAQPSPYSGQR